MRRASSLTLPASGAADNEDAMVVDDGVVVVVDGAGIPAELRAGCQHSVAWFAQSVAKTLHTFLAARSGSMVDALAETVSCVRESHATTCDLDRGSPSATVAAVRMSGPRMEYLVLCDAALVLVDRQGRSVEVTDRRLEHVLASVSSETYSGEVLRARRRQVVEASRNRVGGFWCVHTDPAAAQHARHGEAAVGDYAGVVVCSDGGARGYDLLDIHTLDGFAHAALDGAVPDLAAHIRSAELQQAEGLSRRGLKVHDDLTIVAVPFLDAD